MSELDPPDDARTKALVSTLLRACEGYAPLEAACAVATIAILISRGELGKEAAYGFAMMAAAEMKLTTAEEERRCDN